MPTAAGAAKETGAYLGVYLADPVTTGDLAALFGCLSEIHVNCVALMAYRGHSEHYTAWLSDVYPSLLPYLGSPTAVIRATKKGLVARRDLPQVRFARISSPGFLSIDGGGALEKVVDILHKGDLDREQTQALTERIQAETDLIRAQAAEKTMATIAAAVDMLKSIGFQPEEIRQMLARDPGLGHTLGNPILALRQMLDAGPVTQVRLVSAADEEAAAKEPSV
jgi:hypothetical protein